MVGHNRRSRDCHRAEGPAFDHSIRSTPKCPNVYKSRTPADQAVNCSHTGPVWAHWTLSNASDFERFRSCAPPARRVPNAPRNFATGMNPRTQRNISQPVRIVIDGMVNRSHPSATRVGRRAFRPLIVRTAFCGTGRLLAASRTWPCRHPSLGTRSGTGGHGSFVRRHNRGFAPKPPLNRQSVLKNRGRSSQISGVTWKETGRRQINSKRGMG